MLSSWFVSSVWWLFLKFLSLFSLIKGTFLLPRLIYLYKIWCCFLIWTLWRPVFAVCAVSEVLGEAGCGFVSGRCRSTHLQHIEYNQLKQALKPRPFLCMVPDYCRQLQWHLIALNISWLYVFRKPSCVHSPVQCDRTIPENQLLNNPASHTSATPHNAQLPEQAMILHLHQPGSPQPALHLTISSYQRDHSCDQ